MDLIFVFASVAVTSSAIQLEGSGGRNKDFGKPIDAEYLLSEASRGVGSGEKQYLQANLCLETGCKASKSKDPNVTNNLFSQPLPDYWADIYNDLSNILEKGKKHPKNKPKFPAEPKKILPTPQQEATPEKKKSPKLRNLDDIMKIHPNLTKLHPNGAKSEEKTDEKSKNKEKRFLGFGNLSKKKTPDINKKGTQDGAPRVFHRNDVQSVTQKQHVTDTTTEPEREVYSAIDGITHAIEDIKKLESQINMNVDKNKKLKAL
mmetsp:Transcript_3502/g.6536  ORF Transcript_3502/g.6536 Transcript_3502/m.6536 type:complete len:261 (-) Transcript_3502:289-1071(-)|eukprot:CAMPEP_0197527638 /NCGR_PEP_ID=MMETSP1318-20131121/22464_1 /TAXON_ID=552666 /ORGANISM="Partenskyella glossopodia, Strain RCC365" /LENGTH=260 /DNA_ID=CAMNT_0043082397 /DNA_START=10 /DNA_END=792 /DNA_ORIENTATION=+